MVNSRTGAVIAGATVLATLSGVEGAVAAGQITSWDIKDQTIKKRDIGPGAVGSNEVRNGTVLMRDFSSYVQDRINQPGPQGETGPMGPQGPKGDTGATGATGAVGPAGPQGPQGEPGKDGTNGEDGKDGKPGIANVKVVKVRSDDDMSDGPGWVSGGRQSIRAQCAPGQYVLGGGFSSDAQAPGEINIVTNDPIVVNAKGDELEADGGLANAWEVEGYYTGEGAVKVSAWAICATIQQ